MILSYARLATACPRASYKLQQRKLVAPPGQQMLVKPPLQHHFPTRHLLVTTVKLSKESKDNNDCKDEDVCKDEDDCKDENVEGDDKPVECCVSPKMPCCADTLCVCPDPCEDDEEMDEIAAHVGGKCTKSPCAKVRDPCESFVKKHIGKKMPPKKNKQPTGGTQTIK